MNVQRHTDEELLALMRQGEAKAFEAVYHLYAERLIHYASARLQSLEEARDMIHDLFVQLWVQRAELSVTVHLGAYLFASVRYRIIDHFRRSEVRRRYQDSLPVAAQTVMDSDQSVRSKDAGQMLQRAIAELSPRLQEVFSLSRFQYLTTAQIAEKLGTSERTVKNQLTSALAQIRAKMPVEMIILFLSTKIF